MINILQIEVFLNIKWRLQKSGYANEKYDILFIKNAIGINWNEIM